MAAAAAITAKYEIGHNLKSIQVRDPIFFPRPMFSRVRNAMKLSFAFYDLSNYLKIQNGRRNWRFQTYSRGVILLFYDHSNYLKILWELQIDVSIIYSFVFQVNALPAWHEVDRNKHYTSAYDMISYYDAYHFCFRQLPDMNWIHTDIGLHTVPLHMT